MYQDDIKILTSKRKTTKGAKLSEKPKMLKNVFEISLM